MDRGWNPRNWCTTVSNTASSIHAINVTFASGWYFGILPFFLFSSSKVLHSITSHCITNRWIPKKFYRCALGATSICHGRGSHMPMQEAMGRKLRFIWTRSVQSHPTAVAHSRENSILQTSNTMLWCSCHRWHNVIRGVMSRVSRHYFMQRMKRTNDRFSNHIVRSRCCCWPLLDRRRYFVVFTTFSALWKLAHITWITCSCDEHQIRRYDGRRLSYKMCRLRREYPM